MRFAGDHCDESGVCFHMGQAFRLLAELLPATSAKRGRRVVVRLPSREATGRGSRRARGAEAPGQAAGGEAGGRSRPKNSPASWQAAGQLGRSPNVLLGCPLVGKCPLLRWSRRAGSGQVGGSAARHKQQGDDAITLVSPKFWPTSMLLGLSRCVVI